MLFADWMSVGNVPATLLPVVIVSVDAGVFAAPTMFVTMFA